MGLPKINTAITHGSLTNFENVFQVKKSLVKMVGKQIIAYMMSDTSSS